MRRYVISVLAAALLLAVSARAAPMFVQPLEGVPYIDWTIANYVDVDPTPGVMDYRAGPYSYNGHTGTDFVLPNFVAMDSGFAVYAAAAGSVLQIHDGEFDRNTAPTNMPANYVKIDHGSGLQTWYWHLRRNSIIVTNGQPVVAGQKIAEIGSSGNSTDAHLHFEVQNNSVHLDPFLSGFWLSPIPYAGDNPGLLDAGIIAGPADLVQLKERATNQVVIGTNDNYFVHWVQVHGLTPSNTMQWTFYVHGGGFFDSFEYTPTGIVPYGWYQYGWPRPVSNLGLWRSVFKVDGVVCSEIKFYVGGAGDSDGDKIDDFVETAPLSVGQDDRFVDSDGDGVANADELLAGTDPGDINSFLCLTNLVPGSAGTDAVSFKSTGGRFYVVESCTNLATGEWTPDHPVPGVLLNAAATATMDNGGAATKFYRLKLVVSP